MEIWRSSDRNRLCSLFWDTVYIHSIYMYLSFAVSYSLSICIICQSLVYIWVSHSHIPSSLSSHALLTSLSLFLSRSSLFPSLCQSLCVCLVCLSHALIGFAWLVDSFLEVCMSCIVISLPPSSSSIPAFQRLFPISTYPVNCLVRSPSDD